MPEPTPEQIDAGAKYLRETLQGMKRLNAWDSLPLSVKKKWHRISEGCLRSAFVEQPHPIGGE